MEGNKITTRGKNGYKLDVKFGRSKKKIEAVIRGALKIRYEWFILLIKAFLNQ